MTIAVGVRGAAAEVPLALTPMGSLSILALLRERDAPEMLASAEEPLTGNGTPGGRVHTPRGSEIREEVERPA
jgi:hypothetical protein